MAAAFDDDDLCSFVRILHHLCLPQAPWVVVAAKD
jgi:hypothetical protein